MDSNLKGSARFLVITPYDEVLVWSSLDLEADIKYCTAMNRDSLHSLFLDIERAYEEKDDDTLYSLVSILEQVSTTNYVWEVI